MISSRRLVSGGALMLLGLGGVGGGGLCALMGLAGLLDPLWRALWSQVSFSGAEPAGLPPISDFAFPVIWCVLGCVLCLVGLAVFFYGVNSAWPGRQHTLE
jgi:hypothetical protein